MQRTLSCLDFSTPPLAPPRTTTPVARRPAEITEIKNSAKTQEFEVEEEASRVAARERDAALEAEKERLAKESTAAADGESADGRNGPGGASDSWILSGGITAAERERVGVQNARRAGHVAAGAALPEKSTFVKDEKAAVKAAAVAKLLAGSAPSANGAGGANGEAGTAQDGASEKDEQPADGDDATAATAGEEGGDSSPTKEAAANSGDGNDAEGPGTDAAGGGEAAALAPDDAAAAETPAVDAATRVADDGISSLPSVPEAAEIESPTPAGDAAEANGGGTQAIPGDTADDSEPSAAATAAEEGVASDAATAVTGEGEKEGSSVDSSTNGDAAAPTAEDVVSGTPEEVAAGVEAS